MIRTWSLLLRNAQRLGYMVSGRVDPQQLQESPYLMHPVEAGVHTWICDPACYSPSLSALICRRAALVNAEVAACGAGTTGLYRTPVCILDFASLCGLQRVCHALCVTQMHYGCCGRSRLHSQQPVLYPAGILLCFGPTTSATQHYFTPTMSPTCQLTTS